MTNEVCAKPSDGADSRHGKQANEVLFFKICLYTKHKTTIQNIEDSSFGFSGIG
jgi:hypothetical protein